MKKLLLIMVLLMSGVTFAQDTLAHWCGSHDKFQRSMKTDLSFVTKMNQLNEPAPDVEFRNITIPVVVHILYGDSSDILSEYEINKQIEGLNLDFNGDNWDVGNTPDEFKNIVGDFKVTFKLATIDPNGRTTEGITYTKTNNSYFSMWDEDAKFNIKGGKDAWNSRRYLNIWVCNLESRLRGYAQFPGDAPATDGVVLDFNSFGIEDSIVVRGYGDEPDEVFIQYYRVLQHEVGHWMGLFHIWGDATCGNDKIKDTPTQEAPHRFCYDEVTTCGSSDLPCNYMDYVEASCMVMFTKGQKKRALRAMKMFRNEIIKYGPRLTKTKRN